MKWLKNLKAKVRLKRIELATGIKLRDWQKKNSAGQKPTIYLRRTQGRKNDNSNFLDTDVEKGADFKKNRDCDEHVYEKNRQRSGTCNS